MQYVSMLSGFLNLRWSSTIMSMLFCGSGSGFSRLILEYETALLM